MSALNFTKETIEVQCRIRYNAPEVRGFLTYLGNNHIRVDFAQPQKAVTPGQSVVFYKEDVVLAGAIIAGPIPCEADALEVITKG